jgi:hypothetical protein
MNIMAVSNDDDVKSIDFDFGSYSETECGHVGCNWCSKAKMKNDQRWSRNKHENSLARHKAHVTQWHKLGLECTTCDALIDSGMWVKGTDGVEQQYGP